MDEIELAQEKVFGRGNEFSGRPYRDQCHYHPPTELFV